MANINNSDHEINIQLIEASKKGDLEECTRLVAIEGADLNYDHDGYGTPLHRAVENNKFEIVRFLLKMGSDPSYRTDRDFYLGMNAKELAAFRSTDTSKILDDLFRQDENGRRINTELEELRGCRHLLAGRQEMAFICFFRKDSPPNIGSFAAQMFVKCFRVLSRYTSSIRLWSKWISGLWNEDDHGRIWTKLAEFFIRETKLSYELVYLLFCNANYSFNLTGACEIVECMNNYWAQLDDERRTPRYLEDSVAFMISKLSPSALNHQLNDKQLLRFAESVKNFPLKNKLLSNKRHGLLEYYPYPGRVRFLIELCKVDPNSEMCGEKLVFVLLYNKSKKDWENRSINLHFHAEEPQPLEGFDESLEILLKNGLHLCRSQVEEIERRLGFDLPRRIPKLKCLAASVIAINDDHLQLLSKLPKPLKNFVKLH